MPATCTNCGETKRVTSFSPDKRKKNGLKSQCKQCCASESTCYATSRYWNDPEYREKKKKYDRDRHRRRYDSDPQYREDVRRRHFLSTYGMTLEDHADMLESQQGRCAICGFLPDPEAEKRADRTLEVDHDHETGEVRGLLCRRCNDALGKFGDDPDLVLTAACYLASTSW